MLQEAPSVTVFIIKALNKLLRPLVSYLISTGITYPVLSELLKKIFIEVAETEFKLAEKKQTDSRINFLTGIHRKDVKRLRHQDKNEFINAETNSLSALLISRWLGDPNYSDQQGNPLSLPRLIKQGGDISFESLVISINKDIRSRAILDEWLNMNIVYMDENDCVVLNINAFVPQTGYEEKTWFFAEDLHDHIAAAVHNLKGNSPTFLERAVYYDQLSPESVEELRILSEKLGMETLIKINSCALKMQTKDKHKGKQGYRMRLGLYFFSHADGDNKDQQKD